MMATNWRSYMQINTQSRIIPKYIGILIMLYTLGPLSTMLLVYKEVSFLDFVVSAGSFLSPLWYLTSDIITEVYGYKVTRNLFWSWGVATVFIAFLINVLVYLPSPAHFQHGTAYHFVMGKLLKDVLDAFIAMGISSFVNAYLLSKWKIILSGRYYWLRSVCSSAIGVCVLEIVFAMGIINAFPLHTLVSMVMFGILSKIVLIAIFAVPSNYITYLLKRYENIDVFDVGINYNPFSLKTSN